MKTSCSSLTRREFLSATAALGVANVAMPRNTFADTESPYQIGCYTRPWDQFDYRVALDGIADAGFKYAGLEMLVDYCALCACQNLLLGGTTDEKLVQPYYKVVAECCDYAASKGVGLSVKPHGGQNSTGPQCRKLIDQVGHQNFRLWYDPGNIYYYSDGKLDPADDAATVDGLVVGMSVKDFVPPKEVMVTPGDGRVNFPAVFGILQKGGFTRGPLIVECLARGDTAKITAEAKKARLFLEALTGRNV
jgi:hydroxypyruvate isomerase